MIYFIATKHPEYASERFPKGATVIDPWRYIPDKPGVKVRRLGQNRPALISILVPSRGRLTGFRKLCFSILDTAVYPSRVEIVSYHDDNDIRYPRYAKHGFYDHISIEGPQIVLSQMWNRCAQEAHGEIFMHCGDDIVFRTTGWDIEVRKAFDASSDKILLVHGDDCSPNTDVLATHGFMHRIWYETVGYFVPPHFSSDWNDVWLTEVADLIGRRVKIPIVTEHMHYAFGKAEHDATYRQREERGARDGVFEIFQSTEHERQADAAKLRSVMA